MCFWESRPCATKCEKCEKDGKVYVERVRGCDHAVSNHAKCEDMVVFQDGHAFFCVFFVSLAAAPLSHTHHSQHGLHGVVE